MRTHTQQVKSPLPAHTTPVCNGVALFTMFLLVFSVSFAQTPGAGRPSRYPSRPGVTIHGVAPPHLGNSSRVPFNRLQDQESAGIPFDSGPLLFLFTPEVTYSSDGYGVSSAIADVNGDGKPDLLVVNCGTNATCSGNGSVGVFMGNGDGTFKAVLTYDSGGFGPESLVVADVNGDGKPDLVVANCGSEF